MSVKELAFMKFERSLLLGFIYKYGLIDKYNSYRKERHNAIKEKINDHKARLS